MPRRLHGCLRNGQVEIGCRRQKIPGPAMTRVGGIPQDLGRLSRHLPAGQVESCSAVPHPWTTAPPRSVHSCWIHWYGDEICREIWCFSVILAPEGVGRAWNKSQLFNPGMAKSRSRPTDPDHDHLVPRLTRRSQRPIDMGEGSRWIVLGVT